ncbi:MAG: Gfo/Idh/MocA family oxidoreductase [Candidatus Marsarchaeota archaeon]|nr:Gfo/Idh/MocA family oxidoreductase [Candidatus Marsarchaeota archaeon]
MRIAVLGCGSIGRRHLQNLLALGHKDLIAFDPIVSIRNGVRRELGVRCPTTLNGLWKLHPEVVLVTAPSNLHTELALAAVRHDCHIFIEKPLSHALHGLDILCSEVDRRNLVAMVACNMRFHPGPALVKTLVNKGTVGRIIAARIQASSYLPSWRPWQDYTRSYSASSEWGGILLDSIHEMDLALWFLGPANLVAAASLPASSIGLDTDGLAEIILRHDSGVLTSLHVSFVQRDYRRCCQIIGTEGTIYWDFADRLVRVYGDNGQIKTSYPDPENWEVNQMYLDELDHFLSAVRAGLQTVNPISGGIDALRIALAARTKGV